MIDLTKMNGKQFTLNCDLIESVEETPDTVITLVSGKKLLVMENRQDIKKLVLLYKKEMFSKI